MGCLQVQEGVGVTNVSTSKYWNQGYLDDFTGNTRCFFKKEKKKKTEHLVTIQEETLMPATQIMLLFTLLYWTQVNTKLSFIRDQASHRF